VKLTRTKMILFSLGGLIAFGIICGGLVGCSKLATDEQLRQSYTIEQMSPVRWHIYGPLGYEFSRLSDDDLESAIAELESKGVGIRDILIERRGYDYHNIQTPIIVISDSYDNG
jgi:hypothetical protein